MPIIVSPIAVAGVFCLNEHNAASECDRIDVRGWLPRTNHAAGLTGGLTERLTKMPGRSASELVTGTLAAIRSRAGEFPPSDEITLVAVRA
jgi:hypothetical protein